MSQEAAQSNLSISVLVVEDESLTRTLVSTILNNSGFQVVGSASTASAAMALYRQHRPQVVLLDIDLGAGPTGLDMANAIMKVNPHVGIVFVSSIDDVRTIRPNLPQAPAHSKYLNKGDVNDVLLLIELIRIAFADAQSGTSKALASFTNGVYKEPFTDLQMELMRLVSLGLSNSAIAAERFTTVKSTENAIARLSKKLGLPRDEKSNQRVLIAKHFYTLNKAKQIND